MSFASMHNDYLDPDRAGLNDARAIDLAEDRTLKGYGRRGHGLNGKDADLDKCGQITVESAWWTEDGELLLDGKRYASVCGSDDWTDAQWDSATEIIVGSGIAGEWDGDYWVLSEPYSLKVSCEWADEDSDVINIDRALRVAYDAIMKDADAFEREVAGIHDAFEEISNG